jgi:DNA invertase Pin-like site-specific DNA recombinase
LFDTTSSQGRLVSTLLAAIAEFQRERIKERAGDGRKRAMPRGVKFGRKPKLSDYQRKEALKRCGRDLGRDRQVLRRRYLDDLEVAGLRLFCASS